LRLPSGAGANGQEGYYGNEMQAKSYEGCQAGCEIAIKVRRTAETMAMHFRQCHIMIIGLLLLSGSEVDAQRGY